MIWQNYINKQMHILSDLPAGSQQALMMLELNFLEDYMEKMFDKISPMDSADLATAISMIRMKLNKTPC